MEKLIIDLNLQFNGQIEYHTTLMNLHSNKVMELQKQRTVELNKLLDELKHLDGETINHKHIHDSLFDNRKLDDKLFNTLHQDESKDDNYTTLNNDLLNDQDFIWERIRRSQIALEQNQLKDSPEIDDVQEHKGENTVPHKLNNLIPDLELNINTQQEEKETRPPLINALYKVNPTQRKNIIKQLFFEAKENIMKLAELDNKYKENIDDEIQKEADRLLEVYLKTH